MGMDSKTVSLAAGILGVQELASGAMLAAMAPQALTADAPDPHRRDRSTGAIGQLGDAEGALVPRATSAEVNRAQISALVMT